MSRLRYKLTVLSRTKTNTEAGMGVVVTVSLLVGPDENLSLSGTISMTEAEWERFVEGLQAGLGADVEIEDHAELAEEVANG
jgi:hypothetical protein